MSLFGPPDIEKLKAKNDVEGLIKALSYEKDVYIRRYAASALGKIGDARGVKALATTLRDEDINVREEAAEALGRIGDAQGVEPLIAALKRDDSKIRRVAARSLGQIGDTQCVEPLISAFKDEDPEVCMAAIQALGKINDSRSMEPLVNVMKDEGTDSSVRREATLALSQFRDDPLVLNSLIASLKDKEAPVREGAITVIGQTNDDRAVDILIRALKDTDPNVRRQAADSLGHTLDSRAINPLLKVLIDKVWYVRRTAAEALGKVGWVPDMGPYGAAFWIAQGKYEFGVLAGEEAVKPLLNVLKEKEFSEDRNLGALEQFDSYKLFSKAQMDAAILLGFIGGTTAVKPLIACLKDGGNEVKAHSALALGRIGDERAIGPLIDLLNTPLDRDTIKFCMAAVYALEQFNNPNAKYAANKFVRGLGYLWNERAMQLKMEINALMRETRKQ